jgi:hypothetical protein
MELTSLITGIKAAIDLATTVKTLADDTELKDKTVELYNVIITLQSNIVTVQAENSSLLQKNHSLSQEAMDIITWKEEKSKYSLHEICPQVFVYASNPNNTDSEPSHWLCTQCFEQGVKSILQLKNKTDSGSFYICHNCASQICDYSHKEKINFFSLPQHPSKSWMGL